MADSNGTTNNKKTTETKVEALKRESRGLRGTIPGTLAADTDHFSDDEYQLLKFHGIYQQDDRDSRAERRKAGLDKAWSYMIRARIPGGAVTPEQWLAFDDIAERYAGGKLRLTTRQSIQLHGVVKRDLRETMASINRSLLDTLAACGDVQRNVMACPAPLPGEAHAEVQRAARAISDALVPATDAYHEIWIDGERAEIDDDGTPRPKPRAHAAPDTVYGDRYLPRKFKTGVAIDTDNCIDIYTYDCGLVAVTDNGRVRGYNLLAGGGLGMTHNKPDTVARMASPIAFIPPELAVEAVRAVLTVYRDHGNRTDRRHARLKYLLEEWGVPRFRAAVEEAIGRTLEDPAPLPRPRQHDHVGAHEQHDGRLFYGVYVENGRVMDHDDGPKVRTALRTIVERHRPGIRLTPMQSILFTDLTREQAEDIRRTLREHGVRTDDELSNARRYSMACPALPTCGLALTDAERAMPVFLDALENELDSLGLADAPITARMTGCPNGCARPYNADIGLVGRKPGVYHIFVGGGLAGDRLADLFAADVQLENAIETLRPLLVQYRNDRHPGEELGDFYQRLIGHDAPRTLITGKESPTSELIQLGVPR